MQIGKMLKMAVFAVLCLMVFQVAATEGSDGNDKGFWLVQTSLYTQHFSPDPEHNNRQDLLGLEYNEASGMVYGGATFRNSFGQRSFYGYAGKRFDSGTYPVYFKITGGLLKGYKGEYRDKIPLNSLGIAPVIIPGVGMKLGPVNAEAILLGASAAMLNVGIRF